MAPNLSFYVKEKIIFLKDFMAQHPRIVILLGTYLVTVLYITSSKSNPVPPLRVEQQPLPKPFFRQPSTVIDFPFGNVHTVGQLLVEEEVLFVMYYAPWCAQCTDVRPEFEQASTYLHSQVQFVAINCWYHGGECRKQNNFLGYPVLYFYLHDLQSFRYRGLLQADHMVAFIQSMLRPIKYLSSNLNVAVFMAQHDNAVISYFDFDHSPSPDGLQQYYYAAMRVCERVDDIKFGIITNPYLTSGLHLNSSKSVLYIRKSNTSELYSPHGNFTAGALSKWFIDMRSLPLVQLISSSGSKSQVLSSELSRGPALIVFVPVFPLADVPQHQGMLRELALSYHHCPDDGMHLNTLVQANLYARWTSLNDKANNVKECVNMKGTQWQKDTNEHLVTVPPRQCCQCVSIPSCTVCRLYKGDSVPASMPCMMNVLPPYTDHIKEHLAMNSCRELHPNYNPVESITFCCGEQHAPIHTITHENLYTSISEKESKEKMCRKLRQQETNGWLPYYDLRTLGFAEVDPVTNITGLGCKNNRSLHFYVMSDKSLLKEFLGGSQTVIIDLEKEHVHTMDSILSKVNLTKFIKNFTNDELNRYYRSDDDDFLSEEIVEVTAMSFNCTVLNAEKDVVLLYYTPWCATCLAFHHTFIRLAKTFKQAPNVVFARINTEVNDLPWHLTVESYPSIIIYPAFRKADSVPLPDHIPLRLGPLTMFVLLHITHKLEASVQLCSITCLERTVLQLNHQVVHLDQEISDWVGGDGLEAVKQRRKDVMRLMTLVRSQLLGVGRTKVNLMQELTTLRL